MTDGSVRSHRSFVRELRRQVAVHTPDPAEARADAVRRRCAYGWLEPDGTGRLTVTGEAGRVTAALDRVDGLARSLRSGGDARTLEQLRSDVALDLLLVGWASPDQVPEAARPTFAGEAPVARVNLVVALTTMLGLDDQPGEIPGHGFVPAAVARSIATATGSVWRRLVTDPVEGTALELSTTRYRPTRGWRSRWPLSTGSARHPVAPSRPTAAMSTTRCGGRAARPRSATSSPGTDGITTTRRGAPGRPDQAPAAPRDGPRSPVATTSATGSATTIR